LPLASTGKTVIDLLQLFYMKKQLTIILLLLQLWSHSQTIDDTIAKPAITGFGKADGEKTEIKIGKEGGSFISSDGKIRLIVPEDAVSKKTMFSIQPTTSLMPNGNGKSYQMEPAGVNFAKPLQIVFYYTNVEIKGYPTELLGIARQDDKGQWSSSTKMKLDSNEKTLTIETEHFSTFVLYYSAFIVPESAKVKVNGSLRLRISGILHMDEGKVTVNKDYAPLAVKTESAEIWSVNGIQKGNSTVGLISASQDYTAIYQAPAQVPSQNPVAVTVKENFHGLASGAWDVYTLVSNITIYDNAYEVKMVADLTGSSPAAWAGAVTYHDEGSFMVSLQNDKPEVFNIKNQMEVMTNNCTKVILNPNSNTGMLHVEGVRQIKITPANPPSQPYPIVEIWFTPFPIELTQFRYTCPPPPGVEKAASGSIDASKVPMMMFMGRPAIPQYIKFIAKDDEQTILSSPAGMKEISYRVWVKKIKEEN
jgi:hypothetical protein